MTDKSTAGTSEAKELVALLTEREREVLIFAAKGATHKHIAQLLGISRHTVESYLKSIHRTLDLNTTIECAVVAAKAGIL